jgi:glutathione synthase/RimK-type ligase-like ATP-grasp enzyme
MGRISATVAIATCSEVAGKVEEDLQVIQALRRLGIEATHAVWNDPRVDWSTFALVVVRSTWDYPDCRDDFLAWAGRLQRVLNPLPILRWNTDKHYLEDLARAGLPVIPTRFLKPGAVFELPTAPFVVKPAISCAGRDTARYQADEGDKAHEHVHRLHAIGRTVMVQPYLADIEAQGEVAVIYIGGRYSHSIRRGALLNRVKLPEASENPLDVRVYEATPRERAAAEDVMSHVPGGSAGLLYGRVDLVPGPDGEPLVLELELTEPSLFLGFDQDAVDRLAECIDVALAEN